MEETKKDLAPEKQVQAEEKENRRTTIRLQELMAKAGINMTEMAARCDMHASNLSGFIKGTRNPTLETLDRLAQALGVPTWQMIIAPEDVLSELQAHIAADAAEAAAEEEERKKLESNADADKATEAAQKPANGLEYDLLTIDPITGESKRYRLVND